MALKLTREGAYGYVSILIAKFPSLTLLSDIVKSNEPVDIQTAISRGIIGSGYSILLQTRALSDAEDSVYSFYNNLFSELKTFMPYPYDSYVKYFIEIFDLDKIVSATFSTERSRLKLKHTIGYFDPLVEYIVYAKKAPADFSSYVSCLNTDKDKNALNTVKCLIKAYAHRVTSALDEIARLEPIENSRRMFYVFSLLRFYRYITNSKLLKETCNAELKDFAKGISTPPAYFQVTAEVVGKLEEHVKKDPTLLTVYELKAVHELLKLLLYTPHSLVDRLTYLLIHKYYEVPLIRYLVLSKHVRR